MTAAMIFFVLIGAVSLAAAIGVVVSRNPIHSALFLLTNFVTLAIFFVTLDAQFLAAAQVIIYAGGIVILILFVIMLIGSEQIEESAGNRIWVGYVGVLLGVLMLSTMIYSFAVGSFAGIAQTTALAGGRPEVVGFLLFTQYILPFELVAILLLVALLGALLLARRPKNSPIQ